MPRGVAQGHMIIISTVRNDHLFVHIRKIPGKIMNSHFTRSTPWVYSIAAVPLALFGYSR